VAVLRSLHVYETLAEAAEKHLLLGERDDALDVIQDALALLEEVRDRRPFARVLLGIGECLLELGAQQLAAAQLAEAVALADALPDVRLGARARCALGRAWLPLHHPSARSVLEQAAAMYRELGDEENARAISAALAAK
jgi:tetratricopeptide (TPR) repeat protein